MNEGLDESWYIIEKPIYGEYHYSHQTDTVKYYFEEYSEDGQYTWTTDVDENVANEIKTAYADSMKKWNNVYFYSHDSDGNIIKKKLINVIEGTEEDHNLSIFPKSGNNYIATTQAISGGEIIESGTTLHRHYSEWKMNVYVYYFYVHGLYGDTYINAVRERNGAHEFGHVLGLADVDVSCTSTETEDHHNELLMGYGSPMENRAQDISYKDIAGAAITRGFHTDIDHKWLYDPSESTSNNHRLICSICNGVKYVDSLNNYTYDIYECCEGNHNLSSENMMVVASYGEYDYYKCKYCRYVATFNMKIEQNYQTIPISDTHHKTFNEVLGLEYNMPAEPHTLSYVVNLEEKNHTV